MSNENAISEYYEVLTKYYVYKNKYGEKIKNIKKNINKMNLDKEDRRTIFLKKKSEIKCLNCNKVGGMIFEDKNRILKLSCGAAQSCNLNIEIQKNRSIYLPDKLNELIKTSNKYKNQIVKIKLNLLFELEDEDVSIKNFNDIKLELTTLMDDIKNIKTYISDINKIPINELDQTTKISKEKYKKNALTELSKYVNQYKSMMNGYMDKPLEDKRNMLDEAVTLYSKKIQPVFDDLNKSIYDIYKMEIDEQQHKASEFRLYKKKNSIEKLTNNNEFKVIQ